ncbi:acylphosphatase [Paucimonas lemoignei]|uniref:acylphosphatase n=1 Tax=Paucimonas lemoignei TaxID=29443 RepID=A0A4V6NXZ5_PAULE|nr:acylphosphatase [Paucimonas lemoignei]TCS37270.1 acylphosphatase [Paucimonas lemoignei]
MPTESAASLKSARHLRITGQVQGVGYRAAFEHEARALQLSGWVRNRMDGSVEAVVAGPAESLERIIAWAWKGPVAARVDEVVVSNADSERLKPATFERWPTA